MFGKDRAIGKGAKDPAYACEQIEKKEEALGVTMSLENDMDVEASTPDAIDSPTSICQPTSVDTSTATIGKKNGSLPSKREGTMIILWKTRSIILEGQAVHVKGLEKTSQELQTFLKKRQGDERRMALFEEIMKIEGLNENDMSTTSEVISKDKSKIDFFFILSQQFKRKYMIKQLEGSP